MVKALKQFVEYQKLFIHYTRWRLLALYFLIASSGFIEALGIVAVLPLLNTATGDANTTEFSRSVTNVFRQIGIEPTVPSMLLVIVGIFFVRGFIVFLYSYFTAKITVMVRRDIQVRLTKRFCDMEYAYYSQHPAGWFNNVIVNEVGRFVSSLRSMARVSVSFINAMIFLPLVLSLRFELAIFIFGLGSLALLIIRRPIQRTTKESKLQTKNAGLLNAEFIQLIQSFVYLKATSTLDVVNQHVISSIYRLTENELQIKRIGAIFAAVKEPVAVAVLAVFIYWEIVVLGGSLAEILVVALLIYRAFVQLASLAPELQTFNQTIGGVMIVKKVAQDLDNHTEPNGTQELTSLNSDIVLDNVSFNYDSTKILKDINIIIRPNETIGIVGASGAGKTSFFYLLTGLLEPSRGDISVGGISYSAIDKRSLRERIGYVTQDPVIFNDTVEANISMWSYTKGDKKCMARIRSAARLAKCDVFIRAMPKGYQSVLGERGINLSGGERQRIAIAREIFRNSELLIFDEAASALDAESEHYIQQSIDRMHGKRTVVIISHRLASVRHCDRIYVFKSGRAIEEGTFAKLYARKKSYFRQLCNQQEVSA